VARRCAVACPTGALALRDDHSADRARDCACDVCANGQCESTPSPPPPAPTP
jgi:hypothetical protein